MTELVKGLGKISDTALAIRDSEDTMDFYSRRSALRGQLDQLEQDTPQTEDYASVIETHGKALAKESMATARPGVARALSVFWDAEKLKRDKRAYDVSDKARITTAQEKLFSTLETEKAGLATELDPDRRLERAFDIETIVDTAVGGRLLTAQGAAGLKRQLATDLAELDVSRRIEEDPAGTLEGLREGRYSGLTLDARRAMEGQAVSEIQRRERKGSAEARAFQGSQADIAQDYTRDVLRGYLPRVSPNDAMAAARASGDTETLADTEAAVVHQAEVQRFVGGTVGQQEAELRATPSGPGMLTREQGQLYKAKATSYTALTKALDDGDGLLHAERQGLVEGTPPVNWAQPDPALMASKAHNAKVTANAYGVPAVSPLTSGEVQSLTMALDAQTPQAKVNTFQRMAEGFGNDQLFAVAESVSKKHSGVLGLTMGMSVDQSAAAVTVLEGLNLLKESKSAILPQGQDRKGLEQSIVGQLHQAYRHSPEALAATTQAVTAYYAKQLWDTGDLGEVKPGLLTRSIDSVTGGLIAVDNWGMSRDYTVQPAYPGQTEDQFLEAMKIGDYSDAAGVSREDILGTGVPESLGNGRYLIRVGVLPVESKSRPGQRFVLQLGGATQ